MYHHCEPSAKVSMGMGRSILPVWCEEESSSQARDRDHCPPTAQVTSRGGRGRCIPALHCTPPFPPSFVAPQSTYSRGVLQQRHPAPGCRGSVAGPAAHCSTAALQLPGPAKVRTELTARYFLTLSPPPPYLARCSVRGKTIQN